MKRFFLTGMACLVTAVFMTTTTACAASVKIGIIDTQKIMKESKAAKDARGVFLMELERKRSLLRERQTQVQEKERELREKGIIVPEAEEEIRGHGGERPPDLRRHPRGALDDCVPHPMPPSAPARARGNRSR